MCVCIFFVLGIRFLIWHWVWPRLLLWMSSLCARSFWFYGTNNLYIDCSTRHITSNQCLRISTNSKDRDLSHKFSFVFNSIYFSHFRCPFSLFSITHIANSNMLKFTTLRLMMGHFLCILNIYISFFSGIFFFRIVSTVVFWFNFNCSCMSCIRCSFGLILFAIKIEWNRTKM